MVIGIIFILCDTVLACLAHMVKQIILCLDKAFWFMVIQLVVVVVDRAVSNEVATNEDNVKQESSVVQVLIHTLIDSLIQY